MQSKPKHIQSLALLAIYFLSIWPSLIAHHHHHIVSFDQADHCEKKMYYNHGHCGHAQHISSSIKKCALCDTHTNSLHLISTAPKLQFKLGLCLVFNSVFNSNYSALVLHFGNKGPPQSATA